MKILCYSPYNKWYLHGMWEITILHALRLRGATIKFVTCDGLYSECDVHWLATNPRTPNACKICMQENSTLATRMHMPYEWLGQYVRNSERQEAHRWAQSLAKEELLTAQYRDWSIGEWVRSSVRSHFRINHIDLNHPLIEQTYRRYLASGLIAAFALNRLLDQYNPDLVFLFNGRFSSLRVAFELARERNIRVLTHERGWLNESIRLAENALPHDPTNYLQAWERWQDIPLTTEELEVLQQYLNDRRWGRRANQDAFVPPPQQSLHQLRQQLQIPEDAVIWSLFTSSDDEILDLHFFPSPFQDQFDWIERTIKFVQQHPDLYLIIRVHPNVKSRRSIGANFATYQWFQQLQSRLPPTVRLIMPEEEVNSYLLGDLATLVLVYGSTIGLELAAQGKYVLTAARPWYDGLEVLQAVHSVDSYTEQLDGLRQLPRYATSEVIARQAQRYAYMAFFRCSIPFPLVEMPTARTGRLRYSSLDALRPGKDAALDTISTIVFDRHPPFELPEDHPIERSIEQELQWHRQQSYVHHCNTDTTAKVSVIIPCYNHRHYLRQCVESIALQTFPSIEILIVDDGSTDGSAKLARQLQEEHRDLLSIEVIQQKNSGQPAIPRNVGIQAAQGQYILCLDADDFLAPDYIATAVAALEHSPQSVAIASGDQQDVGCDNTFHPMQEFNPEHLKIYNHLLVASLFRKHLWEEIGGFRLNVRGYEDWDFWLAAAARGYQACHIRSLFFYRCSNSGVFAQTQDHDLQRKAQIVQNNVEIFAPVQQEWAQRILQGDQKLIALSSKHIPKGFIPPPKVAQQLLQSSLETDSSLERITSHSPCFSIIIPTFNRPQLLRQALDSVLHQSFTDFEVIIVNDGGSDLRPMIQHFNDSRLRLIQRSERQGPAAARNAGIDQAQGQYLIFLDDDDVFLPDYLSSIIQRIRENPTAIHYTDYWLAEAKISGDTVKILSRKREQSEDFHPWRLHVGNCAPTPTFVVPRQCFQERSAFNTALPVHEDWELWLRLSADFPFYHHAIAGVEIRRYVNIAHLTKRYGDLLRTTEWIYRQYPQLEQHHLQIRQARRNHLQFMRDQAFTQMPDSTVSIIIPVHNNLSYTRQCLENIPQTVGNIPYEVIVIDNGSDEETANYLRQEAESGRLVLIRNEQNESFSRVNNQGAAVARGKFLVFLNNDTRPLEGWLEAIVDEFCNHPETGIVGAKLLYENGKIQHAGMVFGARPGRPEEPFHAYLLADADAPFVNRRRVVQFVTGACLAIRKELFDAVGGFDEAYTFGWEDADLCMKVQQKGYQVVYQPKAVLYHFESITKKLREQHGETFLSDQAPHEQANRQRFFQKWGTIVQRDMERFFAEDGFEIRNNQLVPKSDRSVRIEESPKPPQTTQTSDFPPILTSFNQRFWQRNYSKANAVLIKSTDAFGDTLTITSVVATLKRRYPHLKIFVAGKGRTHDIFLHNPDVTAVIDRDSAEAAALEITVDEIIDYTNIIAKLPEYYNGIGYRDIFGNLAGIPFQYEQIIYTVTSEEQQWAKQQLLHHWQSVPTMIVGLHLLSNKEAVPNKRNYPHGAQLISLLLEHFPKAGIILFGTTPIDGITSSQVIDAAANQWSLRQQMALSQYCSHFITIDSAFFHVGHNLWKKPTLLICGLTNPWLSGNPDAGFAFVRNEALECLECYWQRQCANECMTQLDPQTVLDAFRRMVHDGVHPLPPLPQRTIRISSAEPYEWTLARNLHQQRPVYRLQIEDPEGILPPFASLWNGVDLVAENTPNPRAWERVSLWNGVDLVAHSEELDELRRIEQVLTDLGYTVEHIHQTENGKIDIQLTAPSKSLASRPSKHPSSLTSSQLKSATSASPSDQFNEAPESKVHIIWEGSQFVTHSLALINRHHCLNLLRIPNVELTIVPYEQDQFSPNGDPQLEALAQRDIRFRPVNWETIKSCPTVWIRHQWPPKTEPVPVGKWIIMQPWEFSHLRQDFVKIFQQADEIWTPSTFSREAMIRSGLSFEHVQVIPNGVDPQRFTPYGDQFPLPTTKKLRLLFVGGTIFRKGIDILLRAYVRAFSAQDDVALIIKDLGGDSFYRGQTAQQLIAEIRQNSSAPEIIYIDETLSEDQMAQLYRACHVLVMPYRGEGFSLPTLEAMASGLAVIVTEGGATEDFVDDQVGWKIPARRRPIGNQIDGHPLTGDAWVLEPDEDVLVQTLKSLYERPHEAFLRGIIASYRARKYWSWQRATLKLLSRVDAMLGTTLRFQAQSVLSDFDDGIIAVGMAEEALGQGDIDTAIQQYESALRQRGLPLRYALLVLHRLALLSVKAKEYTLATDFLTKADALYPDHPDALYVRAIQQLQSEQWNTALELLQRLHDHWQQWRFLSNLGYGLDTILVDMATIRQHQNDREAAIQLLQQSITLNPSNTEAQQLLEELSATVTS